MRVLDHFAWFKEYRRIVEEPFPLQSDSTILILTPVKEDAEGREKETIYADSLSGNAEASLLAGSPRTGTDYDLELGDFKIYTGNLEYQIQSSTDHIPPPFFPLTINTDFPSEEKTSDPLYDVVIPPFQPPVDRGRYDSRFSNNDLISLRNAGLSPEDANRANAALSGLELALLKVVTINSSKLLSREQKLQLVWQTILDPILVIAERDSTLYFRYYFHPQNQGSSPLGGTMVNPTRDDKVNLLQHYVYLGRGKNGIIIQDLPGRTIYKVGRITGDEIRLMRKVKGPEWRESSPNYVANVRSDVETSTLSILAIDYIPGKSLEHLLTERAHPFSSEEVVRYGSDIFNGLLELKQAGIYHRDLWLGNVVINVEKSRAVIVDLGLATDQPNAPKLDNRRYGGENDLQSLGQIMYKMVTGRNLFNHTHQPTEFVASEVQRYRDEVYQQEFLAEKIADVERQVPELFLRELIHTCLTARSRPDNSNFAPEEVYDRLANLFSRAKALYDHRPAEIIDRV